MYKLTEKVSVAKKTIVSELPEAIANGVIRICKSSEEGARARAICETLRYGEKFDSICYSIEKVINN